MSKLLGARSGGEYRLRERPTLATLPQTDPLRAGRVQLKSSANSWGLSAVSRRNCRSWGRPNRCSCAS